MTRPPEDLRYHSVAITFHWTIAVLVIANLLVGLLHGVIPALGALMGAHKAIGITVLVLTAGRVAWRLAHRPPPLPPEMRAWEKGLAHATHWLLYLLLVAMPLTGWAMTSAGSRPLVWFGLFDIPKLPVDKAIAGASAQAHGLLGWLMLALVVLHIAAALRHRFVRHDQILARMAPVSASR